MNRRMDIEYRLIGIIHRRPHQLEHIIQTFSNQAQATNALNVRRTGQYGGDTQFDHYLIHKVITTTEIILN